MDSNMEALNQQKVASTASMTPKQRCKDIRDRFYPFDERPGELFFQRVMALKGADRNLAEIGCGRVPGFLRRVSANFRTLYGFDPEIAAPSEEGNIRLAQGFAEHLELPDKSVDAVVSADVVEHLEDPHKAFSEFIRVLRPGGRILAMTPNKNHPPLFVARLLNHRTRQILNSWATGTRPEDTFRVFYHLNTVPAFKRLANELGLKVIKAEYISNHPQYLMFSRLSYRMGIMVERNLLNTRPFAFLRQYILAELEKPQCCQTGAVPKK
jgi:SAM-dependent methyltransferase